MRHNQMLIIYASVYHILWGFLLFAHNAPIAFTASIMLTRFISNPHFCGLVLILVAASALFGIYGIPSSRSGYRFAFLLPQQLILWLSAISILGAVFAQQFGDGVPRSWQFIFLDQVPMLLACFFYTAAMFEPLRLLLRVD